MAKTFRELKVWQLAVQFASSIYELSRTFPKDESFGMTSQIRRAAVSVSSNIAEGWGRNRSTEFARFLEIALGSLRECESLLEVALEVGITTHESVESLKKQADDLGRALYMLHKETSLQAANRIVREEIAEYGSNES
ncbi:MAG: four helix bundle protein [Fimbriimonadaceae bacterium]|nr:four helix bundle protein [Fimbriimonadaceae bacterium]